MHEIGYPSVDEHSKIQHHAEFPDDVLYSLNEWLATHFLEEDMKIARFVKTSVARPIGEHLYEQFLPQAPSPT